MFLVFSARAPPGPRWRHCAPRFGRALGLPSLLPLWRIRYRVGERIAQMYNITGAFCLWFIAFNWVSAGGATFENAYHEAHIPSGGHQKWW